MGRRLELATRAAIGATLVASACLGWAYPTQLLGAASWSITVATVLYGLGDWVGRLGRIELALDECIVAGTGVWIGGTGWLLAIGKASRVPLLVLAGIGFLTALVAVFRRPAPRAPAERGSPGERTAWVVLWVVLAILLTLNLLGSVGTHGNPADDQPAYTAFVRRVLDRGDLVEPFSLRRLSAYGGQTLLHALAALRGDVASIDLLDHGIFQWIAMLVVLGIARRRGLALVVAAAIAVVVLSLWDSQLNSGAVWTGVTCFLAAYGFASRPDRSRRQALGLAFLALGAACTLRQNYLLPAGAFGLLLLGSHLREAARQATWRRAWLAERTTVLVAIGVTAAVVVPYMIAAVVGVGTPLYPILPGTANPAMPLRPAGGTWIDELRFFISVSLSGEPIHVWWLLLPVMALAVDRRPLRPWPAFLIASVVGFVAMVHSFLLSDTWNMWRYAFGYLTALAVAFAIEVGADLPLGDPERRPTLGLPRAGAFVVWLALALNLVDTRLTTLRRFNGMLQNLRAGEVFGSTKRDPRLRSYAALQRAVPEGARLAVLLDDPWMLDYARNPIFNLDLPGCAAPGPGLPSFTDPAHWRSYFASLGIRYVAFVDPEYSAYLYRRDGWRGRMFADDELFQFIAAHAVDAFDALIGLARSTRVVFHDDAMYVVDLGDAVPPEADRGAPEAIRMDRFIAQVSEREFGHKGWQLIRRSNVVFEDDGRGYRAAPQAVLPAASLTDPTMNALVKLLAGAQGAPHRWLSDRTRIRVLGTGRERLHARLWIDRSTAASVMNLVFSIDGRVIAEAQPDRDGYVVVDAPAACTGWCDLYIASNGLFEWGPGESGVAALFELDWAAP